MGSQSTFGILKSDLCILRLMSFLRCSSTIHLSWGSRSSSITIAYQEQSQINEEVATEMPCRVNLLDHASYSQRLFAFWLDLPSALPEQIIIPLRMLECRDLFAHVVAISEIRQPKENEANFFCAGSREEGRRNSEKQRSISL